MRIVITGAVGIIGSVLLHGLSKKYEVVGIDRKASSNVQVLDLLSEHERLLNLIDTEDVIVHLAWDIREGGTALEPVLVENKRMGEIIFNAALKRRAKRLILASSVHVSLGFIGYRYPGIVEDHRTLHPVKKITVANGFYPLGVYGASKVYLEALGRAYANQGLSVIAVRFGNVTPDDSYGEYPFWLSHRDCCQFIEKCFEAEQLPPFTTYFAVSNNACNPFDLSTAKTEIGYEPQDGSSCPEGKS